MASEKKSRLAERIEKMQQEASQNNGGNNTASTSQTTTNTEGRLAQRINNMRSSEDKSTTVDDDIITVFLSDASKYLNQAKSKYEGVSYSNAYDTWSENRKASENLLARSYSIRDHIIKNKSSYDENTYSSITKQLSSIQEALRGYSSAFRDTRKFYSQFKTEDEYNKWKKETEEYEAMMSYDTKKGSKEIEDLMKQAEADEKEYWDLYNMRTSYLYNASLGQPDDMAMGIDAKMQEILDKYGAENIDDIQNQITKKKQYHTQAERLQEGVRLGSVGDKDSEYYDPEYDYWAKTRSKLPNREDLVAYDSMMDQTKWYTDANGKLFDAYGTEIDPYKTDAKGNILHPSQGSVDSSDKLGIFLSASEDDVQQATATYLNTGGTWETIVAEGSQRNWDQMEEGEVNTYYYYLNKEGREAAEKYLNSIQETLNYRAGTETALTMKDKTALELLFKVAVGFDQFNSGMQGVRNAITGNDEYIPVTATQVAGSLVQEDLGDVGFKLPEWMSTTTDEYGNKVRTSIAQAAGDFISTSANMLPSILTSTVVGALNPAAGAAVGTGLLSASAGGNAYTEMINLGYDKDQSRTYAAMVGASEAVLQSLLGGISQLGGGAISKGVTKALGKADNVLAKLAIQIGNSNLGKVLINAFEEGQEEYFQSILEPWFRNIIFGEENEIDLLSEEALYSALLGALTGGVFEGSGIALETVNTNAMLRDTGKAIIGADGGVDALKALAMDVAGANPKLTKQANKVSSEPATGENLAGKVIAAVKNSSNQKKVGKLYQAVESTVNTQNQADIAKALNESGFSKSSAKNIAEAVVAQANGEDLNNFQKATLESVKGNKKVDEIVTKIINDPESGVSKRTGNMDIYSMGIMLGKGIAPEATREAQKTSLKVSEEGKTTANGKEIKVEFADNGLIATEDGTVTVSDVEYSTATEAYVVETIAELGLKADAANSLLRTANAKGMNEVQAQAFAMGLKTAYNMGRIGNLAELTKNYFTSKLTAEQRETAYAAGLRERNVEVAARQAAINEAKQKAEEILASKSEPIDKSGKVIFENGVSKKDLSKKQKAAYLVAKKVSSTMGNDIHLYSGKAEYGFHDAETGDVWLNINASASGKDLTLFTLSHEMIHHAKLWSAEEFTAFADMLLEAYGEKGVSVEQMIKNQIRKAKAHGITLTREAAYEEVICDACGRMLLDSNALEKLSLLEETNPGIIEKIKAFLQEFLKKIREMFKDVEPHTAEAIYLSEMEADVKALLYEKFENLMVSTGKTYSTIKAAYGKDVKAVPNNEIITDGAVTIENDGKKYSIKSMKHDIAEGKMFDDLRTVCGWTEAETTALKEQLEVIVSYMIPFRDIVDMNETSGRDNRRFSPYKPNSDPLYTISMDFSTLCSKRLLTQYVIENLQLRENRPMSAEEQIAIRDMLIEYRQQEKALQVACAMCYVEAARLKSPKQMAKWMDDPSSYMRDYFADRDPVFKQKIQEAQEDFKESRGYERKAPKKDMKQKDVTELNKIRPNLRKGYTPTAEEQAVIDRAVSLPNSVYLTAGNLADLSESDPIIYKAYTSFVRTATRSKGLEEDIAYYYGDSTRDNGNGIIVSDSFIESVNRENGMRFSSWSDWRIEHLLDYITAVIDNSVRGAAMHGYTKFPDEVRVLGNTGMMFNMSGVAGTQTGLNEDGSLSFSETESINFEEAKALREEFPETAGLQCIGVGDEHIRQMLRSDIIDYVIPYHTSGLNAVLRRMVNIHGWKDYTGTQHATPDKSISKDKAKDPDNWHKEPVFSEFFVGYNTGLTGVEAMKKTAENYIRMCQERGLTPKFAQFMDEDGYWKLLIDRKMVNNKTGELIQQKPVRPIFKTETIKGIVDKYVDNYDGGLQSKALNHIVENWDSLPGRIKDLKKAKKSKAKKALDTLANETVVAKPKKKFSLPEVDTDGNNLSAEQQKYFKDSVVRDADGNLMVMYHGTADGGAFTVFDGDKLGNDSRTTQVGQGFYFTNMKKEAEAYKHNVDVYGRVSKGKNPHLHQVYLNITNPFNIDTDILDIEKVKSVYMDGTYDYFFSDYIPFYLNKKTVNGRTFTKPELQAMSKADKVSTYVDYLASFGSSDYAKAKEVLSNMVRAFPYGKQSELLTAMKNRLGYDGIVEEFKPGQFQYVAFSSEQIKSIDNSKPTSNPDIRYSLPEATAPTFYSYMAEVVDGVKQEKLGAASVVSMLRGKGVKAEEIKWSGIEDFLEGKKSVTKAELQEFIAGSMLQIEEETLDYKERPYTEDQKKRLDEYEAKRNEIARRVADEWKRVTGEEFPVQNPGYDLESTVARKIIDTNLEYKKNSFEGRLLEKLRKDLQKVSEDNDDFGFDSWRDVLRSVYRHRKDFIKFYELSANEKAVIVKFCNALEAQNALPPKISEEDSDRLRTIARETAPWDRKIMEVKHEYNEEAAKHMPKWGSSRYNLKGGENYREILFRIPESDYTNDAMFTHWDDRSGILAHARIQDFNTFLGKMLFIEELQSDWHNDGHKDGYASEEQTVRKKIADLSKQLDSLVDELINADASRGYAINQKMDKIEAERERLEKKVESGQLAPDAPFSDTYHEYVLKRLIRMAAEEDYDSIGWTPAQVQVERWSKKFAEGYRIEYDQDMPKFLNKYGKKWGTRVGKTVLDNGTEVWSMAITDSMKDSVLHKGQVMYSLPEIEKPTDNKYIKMVEEGATHIGEYDVVPKSKEPKKTILAWKALVVKPGAKNNPKDKSYGNMYPPQVHQVASTPYGVWLYANEAPKKLDKDGNPVLTKYGRPKVKEGMTYRPAWHFGDAPYASQFRSTHGFFDDDGVRRFYMSESKGILVWALCEMAADENYQDEADMAGHIGENRYWDEQQASLWYLPENGYYKYMTNRVDPNSVTWYLSDKMRIVQTITDAEMRDILTWIKEDGSTDLEFNYPLRIDGKDVNPADYGIPVGNVVGDGIDYVDRWKNQFREIAMNGEIDITQSHFYYVPSTATSYGDYETVSFSKEVDDHSQELIKTKKDAKILFVNPSSKSELIQNFEAKTGVKVKDAKTIEGRKRIIEASKNEGYDIVEFAKAAKGLGADVVIVNPEAVIRNYKFNNVSERHGRTDAVKYSLPTSGDISTRSLLANAFESVAQNDIERERLAEYKAKIAFVNAKEQRLREINAKLFQSRTPLAKGERSKLQDEAVKLRNQITIYDSQLLRLEASKPLQNVLNREKAKVRKQMKEQAKKDIQQAKLEEQKRYQNRVANHDKVEMRKKIRKTIRDLDKILNHGDKKKNVKDDMKGLVTSAIQSAEVLFTENYSNEDIIQNGFGVQLGIEEQKHFAEAQNILQQIFNLGTGYEAMAEREKLKNKLAYRMSHLRDAFFRERNRLNETKVSEVLGNLADAYYDLQSSEYLYIRDAYHASVHEYLKYLQNEVGGTTVRNMSMSQLENLHKAYTMVLETVRNANKMFNEKLKESRDQLANAIMREVRMAGGEHGDWSKLGIKRNKFSWNNMKPIYAAERIGSETFSRVVSGLFDGQYKWATTMEKARAFQMETAQKYGVNNWDMEKSFEFTSSNGLDFTLNLEQILALYAYSKRDAAHDHITNGGIVFGKNTEVKIEKHGVKVTRLKRSATTYSISDTLLGEIISKLDDPQNKYKKYVDEMQKYLSETMGGLGNEVSMKLYGVKLFGEENYFPLKSAGQYMEKAREADLQKQQGHTSLVNSGFTHAVKPHAKNPIVLDGFMDVWAGHVNEMAMYNGMVLPMEDFRKVYNYHTPFGDGSTSVNGVIENAYGAEATGYFDQLYQELNSGAISDPRESDMLKWVGKFKKASVMMSMSVVVQQPSAIGRAFALIAPKYFIGQRISESDAKKQWDEVKKYAPVAIIKEMGGFDTHTGASAKDFLLAKEYSKDEIGKALKDKDYRKEKADMIMGYLPAKADELTWVAIWQAVKREVRDNNPNLHGEEFLQKAGARFSEVIEKTQVYDSILARSANMRAKTGLMTMATAFMAEPTTTINMVENAIRSKKNVGRVLASVVTSIILNNLLASAIYAMRDDDEDETFLEKYAQSFTSGMVDDLNPVTYYPFLKDIWSIFQGYDVERSDMSIISDVSDALKKVLQLLGKDTSDMDEYELAEYHKTIWSAAMSLVDSGFAAVGVPFKNARREVESWFNTYNTAKSGIPYNGTSLLKTIAASAIDALPVASYVWKTEKSDTLYDAIISGNTAYEDRLRSEYEDEKQITNAIRKGLRENDSRIYEAALAQINGHPEERVKLQREVIADGFTQDDVVIATNAIITKLSPSTSTSEPKKKGLYDTEDFALFVAGGKSSLANESKHDIIATHQINGKTAEEAEKSFQSSAKTDLKEMLLAGTVTTAAAEHALKTYCGMDADEAKTQVNEWNYFKNTGVDYSDKKEKYLAGEISASELVKALTTVEGKTEDEAAKTVVTYTRDAYEDGLFNRSKAADIMVTYGGLTSEEAESKLQYIDVKKQLPDTFVDDAWVDEYYEEVESSGITIEVFVDYRNQVKSITGEGKKERRMAVIDSMPISSAQKDALYYAEGWAASKLYEAPWR